MRFAAFVVFGLVSLCASAQDHLLTHSTDFARVDPALWVAEGWRVANPDPQAVAVKTEDGAGIGLAVLTPNSAMAWTVTFDPIWTEPFSTLALSYFVDGVPAEGGAFIELFGGSTGPVTPSATNTENSLAGGGRLTCGIFTPGLHVELVNLSAVDKLDRVAKITITVRSGAEHVAVRLSQLAFLAKPASGEVAMPAIEVLDAEEPAFTALALPSESLCGLEALRTAYGIPEASLEAGRVRVDGLPFAVGDNAAVTPLHTGATLTLAVEGTGNTLALLCATRLWGSDQGWIAADAHDFQIALHYADGTIDVAQPRAVGKSEAGLLAGLVAYRVALAPEKVLKEITLVEDMYHGQVALIAATLLEEAAVEEVPAPDASPTPAISPESTAPEGLLLERSKGEL